MADKNTKIALGVGGAALLGLGIWALTRRTASGMHALVVKVSPNNGGVTNPVVGTYQIIQTTPMTVSATPAGGFSFDYWLVNDVKKAGGAQTFDMNMDMTIEAVFKANPGPPPSSQVDLIIGVEPLGAGTTNPPAGVVKATYGQIVNLTATAKTGYHFNYWKVNGVQKLYAQIQVVPTERTDAVASFLPGAAPPAFNIITNVAPPEGGVVTPKAAENVVKGTSVKFVATPTSGFTFGRWVDARTNSVIGTNPTLEFVVASGGVFSGDQTIVAEFNRSYEPGTHALIFHYDGPVGYNAAVKAYDRWQIDLYDPVAKAWTRTSKWVFEDIAFDPQGTNVLIILNLMHSCNLTQDVVPPFAYTFVKGARVTWDGAKLSAGTATPINTLSSDFRGKLEQYYSVGGGEFIGDQLTDIIFEFYMSVTGLTGPLAVLNGMSILVPAPYSTGQEEPKELVGVETVGNLQVLIQYVSGHALLRFAMSRCSRTSSYDPTFQPTGTLDPGPLKWKQDPEVIGAKVCMSYHVVTYRVVANRSNFAVAWTFTRGGEWSAPLTGASGTFYATIYGTYSIYANADPNAPQWDMLTWTFNNWKRVARISLGDFRYANPGVGKPCESLNG